METVISYTAQMEIAADLVGVLGLLGTVFITTLAPVIWTIRRILRPIDQMAKARNAPFRFSIGDFLCLFWVIQIPLAFVFQIDAENTAIHYWVLPIMVWAIAPLVWITCARSLSKAGLVDGIHRYIFLGLIVPIVYYGLYPFIGLSWAGIAVLTSEGLPGLFRNGLAVLVWAGLATALLTGGLYTPWLVRRMKFDAARSHDH
jgi:hypothetical protein